MIKLLHDYFDHILSYFTALMAIFISLPLMKIGGAVLLIARLIQDIPPAYKTLKDFVYGITKRDPPK